MGTTISYTHAHAHAHTPRERIKVQLRLSESWKNQEQGKNTEIPSRVTGQEPKCPASHGTAGNNSRLSGRQAHPNRLEMKT